MKAYKTLIVIFLFLLPSVFSIETFYLDRQMNASDLPHAVALWHFGDTNLGDEEYPIPSTSLSMTDTAGLLDNHLNINIKINNELEKLENLEQMEVLFNNKKLMLKDIINISNRFSGDHSGEGIIIISGKHIRKSFEISEASVLDVTPTILALLNLPIGKDMDGKVIVEAIESRFLKEYPVTCIESWEEKNSSPEGITERDHQSDEDIRSKLAELGYL